MWWEYVLIAGFVGLAALYVAWFIRRIFSGKGSACGSDACCGGSRDEDTSNERGLKITRLVQVETKIEGGRGEDP